MEEQWSSVVRSRSSSAWVVFNIAAAIAVLIGAEASSRIDFYDWFVGPRYGSVVWLASLVGGAYFAVRFDRNRHHALLVWAIAALVVVVGSANSALQESDDYRHHNCWVVNETKSGGLWECAPGRNEPYQWYGSDENGGSARRCDFVDPIEADIPDTRGSYWRCQEDEW